MPLSYSMPSTSSCGTMNNNYSSSLLQMPEHHLSYSMITPQYSPDTTVAITLRHFEKEAKTQAENEYDDENGILPPPPPEDDPTIHPEERKVHKKKRKVRSAIVSRRKTAIYLEKLESELETRDAVNATLAKNLTLYKEVISDVRAKIDAMQRQLDENPAPRKRPRPFSSLPIPFPDPPTHPHVAPVPTMPTMPMSTAIPEPVTMPEVETVPIPVSVMPTPEESPLEPTYLPTDPATPSDITPVSTSLHHQQQQQHHQPASTAATEFFLDNPQATVTVPDLFSTISAEELECDDTNDATIAPYHQYHMKGVAVDANISECSDRNISPALRPHEAIGLHDDDSQLDMALPATTTPWRQFQPFQNAYVL